VDVLRVSDMDESSNHAFPYRSKIVGFTFLGTLYCVLIHQACQSTDLRYSLGIGHNFFMNNLTFLHRPEGSRFQNNRHMKVVSLLPYTPAAFTSQELCLLLISL